MSTQLHVFIRHATENPVPSHLGVRLPATPGPPDPSDPSSTHSCECSRAEKWALKSTDDERETCKMRQKTDHHRPHHAKNTAIKTAFTESRHVAAWSQGRPQPHLSLHNDGHLHLVQELQLRDLHSFSVHLDKTLLSSWTPCSIAQQALHRRPLKTAKNSSTPCTSLKNANRRRPPTAPSRNPLLGLLGAALDKEKDSSQYLQYGPTPRTTHTPPGHHTTHKHWG